MVEKIEGWEVGLMICLDQGLRRRNEGNTKVHKVHKKYMAEGILVGIVGKVYVRKDYVWEGGLCLKCVKED
ncbi:hypothetical protein Tco_0825462 [Tanacetum coccineum]